MKEGEDKDLTLKSGVSSTATDTVTSKEVKGKLSLL